jgi:Tfp pilus assembly major pilin PilA
MLVLLRLPGLPNTAQQLHIIKKELSCLRHVTGKSMETNISAKRCEKADSRINERGFSVMEFLVVIGLIAVLSGLSMIYFASNRRGYAVEDQALQIVDIIQEAKQRALTQRRTMRVEINLVQNAVRLIDEKTAGNAGDDIEIARLALPTVETVRVGTRPANISSEPNVGFPVPQPVFQPSSHPSSSAQPCAVLRFTRDGSVFDAGVNGTGTGAVMTGATVYIWKPRVAGSTESNMTRAVTVLGAVGTVRLWDYDHAAGNGWVSRH